MSGSQGDMQKVKRGKRTLLDPLKSLQSETVRVELTPEKEGSSLYFCYQKQQSVIKAEISNIQTEDFFPPLLLSQLCKSCSRNKCIADWQIAVGWWMGRCYCEKSWSWWKLTIISRFCQCNYWLGGDRSLMLLTPQSQIIFDIYVEKLSAELCTNFVLSFKF